tara:strand:+ start:508 stop:717 length:210 start_codon:yes stop_codon:yes gene_type:complete
MKTFVIENRRKGQKIKVTLHNPPFENKNILHKTGWKEKDCIISEVHNDYAEDNMNSSNIDINYEELDDE